MLYSFDTNIFIDLYRKYPRDKNNYDKFWDCIEVLINRGKILISKEVYLEIKEGEDELWDWIKEYNSFIVENDKKIQSEVKRISNKYSFVFDPHTTQHGADPYVIALAEVNDGTVVTNEGDGVLSYVKGDLRRMKNDPNSVRMIEICDNEGIRWLNFVGFLADVGTFDQNPFLDYT